MAKVCSIEGCGKEMHGRGWCCAHYKRWQCHGDPLGGGPSPASAGEPLNYYREIVLAHDRDECLFWPYGKDGSGYAQVHVGGKKKRVSRLVCEAVNGPPEFDRAEAAHSCGKGQLGCIAPRHLSWKTAKENSADKVLHGTINRGERHGLAKLEKSDVIEIRRLGQAGLFQREIAAKFNVHRATIGLILTGKNWGWLKTSDIERRK